MAFDLAAVGGFSNLGSPCLSDDLKFIYDDEEYDMLGYTGFWSEIVKQDGDTIKGGIAVWGSIGLKNYFKNEHGNSLAGCSILLHHSLCKSKNPSDDVIAKLGKYEVRQVVSSDYDYNADQYDCYDFQLDKAPDLDLENFYVQAVLILEFENLTCTHPNSAGIKGDPEYNSYNISYSGPYLTPKPFGYYHDYNGDAGSPEQRAMCGGILAMRVRDTLTFPTRYCQSYYFQEPYAGARGDDNFINRVGGFIDLTHAGIYEAYADYRPLTPQEQNGTLDSDLHAGAENSITKDRLLLNVGDGALFLIAKNIVTQPETRLGTYYNAAKYAEIHNFPAENSGVQYCRGASDSKATHDGDIVGGSSMLIVCNNWTGFNPKVISKYFISDVYGVPSCSKPKGLARCYIACGNLTSKLLADEGLYALDAIRSTTRISTACNINNFGYGTGGDSYVRNYYSGIRNISSDGKTFTLRSSIGTVGGLVMIHQLQKETGEDVDSGKFTLARITAKDNNVITVDTAFPIDLTKYYGQMITLREHGNLTIDGEISAGASWNAGVGGILAIVCYGTLDIRGAKLLVEGQGTHNNVVNKLVGNNFMRSRLYIGQGHGTVFLLARKIIMNGSTRIGGIYPGTHFGGPYSTTEGHYDANSGGGYRGKDGSKGQGGWGGGAGPNGGWFSNAPNAAEGTGLQGAHILIVSDTIEDFRLTAISTGGRGFSHHGGAGYGGGGINYGGGGGYRGGGEGGGGAGACFCYVNKVVNQSTTGIITN